MRDKDEIANDTRVQITTPMSWLNGVGGYLNLRTGKKRMGE